MFSVVLPVTKPSNSVSCPEPTHLWNSVLDTHKCLGLDIWMGPCLPLDGAMCKHSTKINHNHGDISFVSLTLAAFQGEFGLFKQSVLILMFQKFALAR